MTNRYIATSILVATFLLAHVPLCSSQEITVRNEVDFSFMDPALITNFLLPLRTVLRDDDEQITKIVLLTLEPLVSSGRIKIPHDAVSFAGFAYLFVKYAIDGVVDAVASATKDSR